MQPLVTKNGKSWLNSRSLFMGEILLHPKKISTIPLSWKIWLESWQTLAQNPISTISAGKTPRGLFPLHLSFGLWKSEYQEAVSLRNCRCCVSRQKISSPASYNKERLYLESYNHILQVSFFFYHH